MLKNYESMVIISPTFSEKDAIKENKKVTSFIEKNDGEIINTDEWGKKRFAYPILDLEEGFYFVNHYKINSDIIKKFETFLKLNESILRYNILKNKGE